MDIKKDNFLTFWHIIFRAHEIQQLKCIFLLFFWYYKHLKKELIFLIFLWITSHRNNQINNDMLLEFLKLWEEKMPGWFKIYTGWKYQQTFQYILTCGLCKCVCVYLFINLYYGEVYLVWLWPVFCTLMLCEKNMGSLFCSLQLSKGT